ncbi:jerky protein homolog-like [Thrips palmi]|uniref:Jerky protein homolog-like n=1 Tax=Thrips palmi TaxID=161013 RepID=A0A6P9A3W7_THRPL|nr:jerky protein homolog-like [Thrips palmi]
MLRQAENLPQKKKRNHLSVQEKANVSKRLDAGENLQDVAADIGVHPETVRKWHKAGATLNQFVNQCGNKARKTTRRPVLEELDGEMIAWFLQQRAEGHLVPTRTLQEKARAVNKALGGDEAFKASTGWVAKFKTRHGIGSTVEEKSADEDSATVATDELEEFLEEEGYDLDYVYSMAETRCCWKALPSRPEAHAGEKRADGMPMPFHRFTVVMCANATGTHRLPLMVVGRYRKPRCFKHCSGLPVFYRGQAGSCLTTALFEDWFVNCFKPFVEMKQFAAGTSGRVLLLVDNRAVHKVSDGGLGDKFRVKFLPASPAALVAVQPLDHGAMVKRGKSL